MATKTIDASLASETYTVLGETRDGRLAIEIRFEHGPMTVVEALTLEGARTLRYALDRALAQAKARQHGLPE